MHPPPDAGTIAGLIDDVLSGDSLQEGGTERFLEVLYDSGLAAVDNPVGLGGLGARPTHQAIVNERLAAAGAPTPDDQNPIGVGHIAPAIVHWGTEEQHRLLRPLYGCRELWCQLFSEPSAGSDLASVATTATRDGDAWVVSGEKVWTSLAHLADRALLLARSDLSAPKHQGLTTFLIDMRAGGIDAQPLRQMTGEAEFNRVHLDGVRIPDRDRLGEPGQGWQVAATALTHERLANVGRIGGRGEGTIAEVVRIFRQLEDRKPVFRDRVVDAWIRAELHRLTARRARDGRELGAPGPESAVGKLSFSLLNPRLVGLCVDMLGAAGMTYSDYGKLFEQSRRRWNPDAVVGPAGALHGAPRRRATETQLIQAFLRSAANGIEAGTVEIMRNVIADRVLGLPREPQPDQRPGAGSRS